MPTNNPLISVTFAHREHYPCYMEALKRAKRWHQKRPPADWYVPRRKSDGAVGYDVSACCIQDPCTRSVVGYPPVVIEPGEKVLFGAGFIAAIPFPDACFVYPRSGLAARSGLVLANGPGIIDPDFRGEIGVLLWNTSEVPFRVNWADRIAQLVFASVITPSWHIVGNTSDLPATARGTGGFGSTGLGLAEGLGTKSYDEAVGRLDRFFVGIACEVGRGSTCVRGCLVDERGIPQRDERGNLIGATRKVGCVIVVNGSVVASGYNSQYPGAKPCAEIGCLREREKIPSGTRLEQCQAIHAEDMAINNALISGVRFLDAGAVVYCTHEPCLNCARKIAGLRPEALVVVEGSYAGEGLDIIRQAGINVRFVSV